MVLDPDTKRKRRWAVLFAFSPTLLILFGVMSRSGGIVGRLGDVLSVNAIPLLLLAIVTFSFVISGYFGAIIFSSASLAEKWTAIRTLFPGLMLLGLLPTFLLGTILGVGFHDPTSVLDLATSFLKLPRNLKVILIGPFVVGSMIGYFYAPRPKEDKAP